MSGIRPECRLLEIALGGNLKPSIDVKDSVHVLLCGGQGGNALVTADSCFARMVGGQGELKIVIEANEQIAQLQRAAANILAGIHRIGDLPGERGFRHQLHETERPLWRNGKRIEARFDLDDSGQQSRVEAVPPGIMFDDRFKPRAEVGRPESRGGSPEAQTGLVGDRQHDEEGRGAEEHDSQPPQPRVPPTARSPPAGSGLSQFDAVWREIERHGEFPSTGAKKEAKRRRVITTIRPCGPITLLPDEDSFKSWQISFRYSAPPPQDGSEPLILIQFAFVINVVAAAHG